MNLLGYLKSVLETCFTGDGVKKGVKGSKKSGTKRKPSGYNLFIGACMKEDAKPMKQCASDWKSANKETWNQKAKGGL